MDERVTYCQLNKDYAYWTEKRRLGQVQGGHTAGLLTHSARGRTRLNVLIDCGLGTLEALADFREHAFWDEPLLVFITHGHIDHHAELMVLAELYCTRRGDYLSHTRPPLEVFCTAETYQHLARVHGYGFTGGATLQHRPLIPGQGVEAGIFAITPLAVDHFEGAVIFVVEFGRQPRHKILIGWDWRSLPLAPAEICQLRQPSLALLEAATWTAMAAQTTHCGLEPLVTTGFLDRLELDYTPERERYGAYLVHYSGWEDPGGALTDEALKAKFDDTFPAYASLVRVAGRGQEWVFSVSSISRTARGGHESNGHQQ